mmetsp:Transcript_26747/g.85121  ORF Transcript_26747/g.85121 Transcript_26747/m.85121 type:complete len:211 (+) Transcript_26747:378-1010(+)
MRSRRERWMRAASIKVRAAIASTSGGVRGSTHGSWRPLASSTVALPVKSEVSCARPMVDTGLTATRKTMSAPEEMPPSVPPAWLVLGRSMRSSWPLTAASKGSLCCEPRILLPSKPDPIAKPLVAGRLSIACARRASSLSKQGSPRPTGTLLHTQATVPPIESSSALTERMSVAMRQAVSACGQRTCTSSSVMKAATSAFVVSSSLPLRL